jgi:hypothetical protein
VAAVAAVAAVVPAAAAEAPSSGNAIPETFQSLLL